MLRSFVFFSGLAAAAALCVPNASAQCYTGGTGGAIPATGTGGGGAYPATLPPSPMVGTLAVPAIPAGTILKELRLNGLEHTWTGDMHFILQDPTGAQYTVLCGLGDDFGGAVNPGTNFVIIDAINAGQCGGTPDFPFEDFPAAAGTYSQDFGTYVADGGSVANGNLETIVPAGGMIAGNWTLSVYDWVGADQGLLTSWELCFGTTPSTPPPPPPPPYPTSTTCVAGGTGAGYGPGTDGTWPTTLPSGGAMMSSTASITTPSGATKINLVRLLNWNHTWVTDSMVVLTDPAGNNHLIYEGDGGSSCGGCSEDLAGDYEFVDAVAGAGGACAGFSDPMPTCTTGLSIAPGRYTQSFGTWPSGSAGVNNTLIESIPVPAGTNNWTLTIYDWCQAFDSGSLGSWELCFAAPSVAVLDCQILPTVSQTCQSVASSTGAPSASAGSGFTTTFASLNAAANGVVFYGTNGPVSVTWSAQSNLCVKAPTVRLGGVSGASGLTGGTIGLCNGQYSFDMNAVLLAHGIPVSTNVALQAWFRDPAAPKTTQQSDALQFIVGP